MSTNQTLWNSPSRSLIGQTGVTNVRDAVGWCSLSQAGSSFFFFFYVDGFTGVVVVFIPERETVLEGVEKAILGFCKRGLGENYLRW